MRNKRWLVIPFLMIFALGCGLFSSIPNLQNAANTALPALQTAASTDLPALQTAASTEIPALLTSVPTAQGKLETAVASNACTGTTTPGGLGIAIDSAKTFLQVTGQFAFAEGNADNQPAVIVTLTPNGASSFPAVAQGFNAQFIGSPCNLSRVTISLPRTDQSTTADQGVSVLNLLLAASLPPDVQLSFLTWVATNYADIPVSGQKQTTIKNMQFTLQRNQTSMVLDILPAK
ncbi:MAG TPA: hypothetical protein VMT91_07145 [Anaerolineales bacterium]|nr:hypothetical protein [Anaerolineales bacterium]